ncbi:MAG TPA: Uma2 family endonuclease [Solirubrobacteraceae bacterium]|jgi:Uma2 family endonuclease|nr:Uma2 family endonuclease [Solirubrobacteraceae bacterium]
MRTLLPDPTPAEAKELLARRKRLGQDRRDEVWEGVYRVVPAPSGEHAALAAQVKALLRAAATTAGLIVTDDFNVGDSKNDFRIPDGGLHQSQPRGVWIATAALVLEILSPGDETWEKLPFYAAHHVDEVLIIDPDTREAHWLALVSERYQPIETSGLIELGPAELTRRIVWP